MSAQSLSILRRALLYVPGSSKRMLEKSRGITVDTVVYDLEDSVSPNMKVTARNNIKELLSGPRAEGIGEQAVRINSVDSGLAMDDLTEVLKSPNLDALVISKTNSANDLKFVTDVIRETLPSRHIQGSTNSLKLLALIESARAITDLKEICRSTPYLSGIIFAAEDFAADLSITRTPSLSEFMYARSAISTAARAHNLPSTIDLVCTSLGGPSAARELEEECRNGRNFGFNGKQCIHPNQVNTIQSIFSPSRLELTWAIRITTASLKATAAGLGAWTLDSKMIDKPVVRRAEALIAKAERCGIDLGELREEWKNCEPE